MPSFGNSRERYIPIEDTLSALPCDGQEEVIVSFGVRKKGAEREVKAITLSFPNENSALAYFEKAVIKIRSDVSI